MRKSILDELSTWAHLGSKSSDRKKNSRWFVQVDDISDPVLSSADKRRMGLYDTTNSWSVENGQKMVENVITTNGGMSTSHENSTLSTQSLFLPDVTPAIAKSSFLGGHRIRSISDDQQEHRNIGNHFTNRNNIIRALFNPNFYHFELNVETF